MIFQERRVFTERKKLYWQQTLQVKIYIFVDEKNLKLELTIDRKNVFESTYQILKGLEPSKMAQIYFSVQFIGEHGIDQGF